MPDEDDILLEDETTTPLEDEEETIEEVKEEEEKKEKPEEEEGEEEKKEGEEEEELEEEKEPVKIPFDRPTMKEIKEKYPDFFKDFPQVREAIFREAEFTKFFPTVDDAQEAFKDNQAYVVLRDSVLKGDVKPLLDSISEVGDKELSTFAKSFLPVLHKSNNDLYSEVVTPLLENVTRALYNTGNEESKKAALELSKFLFNTDEVAKGSKTFVKGEAKVDPETVRERRKLAREKYESFYGTTLIEIDGALNSLILRDLDPNKVFNKYQKMQMLRDIKERVDKQLSADEGHMAVMNSRWSRAEKDGFSGAAKDKIVAAYLARAKSLIPSVRDKVRSSMLGTKEKAGERKREEVVRRSEERPEVSGRSGGSGSKSGKYSSRDIDWTQTSDLDLLNDNVTLKRR